MRLYKFLSADIARKVIAERRLKISTFAEMNDPFELVGVNLTAPEFRADLAEYTQNWWPSFIQERYGVLCLSKTWTNPILWAHYAEKPAGVALGFDIDNTPEVDLMPVKYVPKKSDQSMSAILDLVLTAIHEQRELTKEEEERAEPIVRKILSTKFSGWAYEHEVRGFTTLGEKDSGLYFLTFEGRIRLVEVILGMRCCLEITQMLSDLSAYANKIKVAKAIASKKAFQLLEDSSQTLFHNPS
jgi:hypothetical protein